MAPMYPFPEQSGHPGQRILLAERIRIAQELHDTLLQGLISASMQLQVALESLPSDSPLKPPLTRILQLLKQAIEESRLVGLRDNATGYRAWWCRRASTLRQPNTSALIEPGREHFISCS